MTKPSAVSAHILGGDGDGDGDGGAEDPLLLGATGAAGHNVRAVAAPLCECQLRCGSRGFMFCPMQVRASRTADLRQYTVEKVVAPYHQGRWELTFTQ